MLEKTNGTRHQHGAGRRGTRQHGPGGPASEHAELAHERARLEQELRAAEAVRRAAEEEREALTRERAALDKERRYADELHRYAEKRIGIAVEREALQKERSAFLDKRTALLNEREQQLAAAHPPADGDREHAAEDRRYDQRVSAHILHEQERRRWTREQMADRLGETSHALSEYVAGKRGMHPAFAVRVAKRLGIDLMRLLDEDPPAPPPPPSDGRARVIPLAERRQLDTAIGGAVTPPGPPDVT